MGSAVAPRQSPPVSGSQLRTNNSSRAAAAAFRHNTSSRHHVRAPRAGNLFGDLLEKLAELRQGAFEGEAEAGGEFLRLDSESSGSVDGGGNEAFGPLAVLAVGLDAQEWAQLQMLLDYLGAHEVLLVPCMRFMLSGSLGDAFGAARSSLAHEPPSLGAHRVLFLSGMYASKVCSPWKISCAPEPLKL